MLAYETRTIDQAIRLRDSNSGPTEVIFSDIRFFFSANVLQSAWGIATHKAARILAVSSNTHKITVFALALRSVKSDKSDSSTGSDDDLAPGRPGTSDPTQNPALPGKVHPAVVKASVDRFHNIAIELHGHRNIPSIAFCNTEEDLEGRYLVSTDINGLVIVWDVWARVALRRITPEDIWRGHGMPGPYPTSVSSPPLFAIMTKDIVGRDGMSCAWTSVHSGLSVLRWSALDADREYMTEPAISSTVESVFDFQVHIIRYGFETES